MSWLDQDISVHVSQQVSLRFSIGGKYVDEIWCNVLPIDFCHTLLDRAWRFDRRVMHDGFKNTCQFVTVEELPSCPYLPFRSTLHELQPIKEQVTINNHDCDSAKFMEDGLDFDALVFNESANKKAWGAKNVTANGLNVSAEAHSNNLQIRCVYFTPETQIFDLGIS